jgi:2-polyprenyl-3-methyl-5-hydroxy-6-metoxy-1,4-benzoquinol methylase
MDFDRFAGEYAQVLDGSLSMSGEDSSYFAEYKALYLKRVLGPSFAGKVLDFGCGVGLLAYYLRIHLPEARIDGFDVSQDSVAKVDPALSSRGLFTSALHDLPRDYDLIVVANVMHHVAPEQRPSVLQDLASRLRPGGSISIFEHNPANPVTRWVVKHCPFDDDAILLRPREAAAHLEAAGLRLTRRDYIVFMPSFMRRFRPLESRLGWLGLGAQYVILAAKHV